MNFLQGQLYHVYNQGNNRQTIFHEGADYRNFLKLMEKMLLPISDVVSYCLMPNHFHLMLYANQISVIKLVHGSVEMHSLSNGIRRLLSDYASEFNFKYNRSGSLFRQKTKAKALNENLVIRDAGLLVPDYPLGCFNYIHNNPVTAGLVKNAADWEFSSFNTYENGSENIFTNFEIAKTFGLRILLA